MLFQAFGAFLGFAAILVMSAFILKRADGSRSLRSVPPKRLLLFSIGAGTGAIVFLCAYGQIVAPGAPNLTTAGEACGALISSLAGFLCGGFGVVKITDTYLKHYM